jgi:hypothetical protein
MIADKELMFHLSDIEDKLNGLGDSGRLLFGGACLLRQREVFYKACMGQNWTLKSTNAFHEILDRLLDVPTYNPVSFIKLNAQCGNLVPDSLQPINFETTLVFTVANSLRDLVSALNEGETSYVRFSAARNIELIEMLADDMSRDCQDLLQIEMRNQQFDVTLIKNHSAERASAELASIYSKHSLFNSLWPSKE